MKRVLSALFAASLLSISQALAQSQQPNWMLPFSSGGGGGGGGAVSSVSNSDGTLTISPTSGAVLASLNLSKANSWLASQTFPGVTIYNNTSTAAILDIVADGFNSSTRAQTYGAGTIPFMELQFSRGTFALPTAAQAGDQLGGFDFEGWDASSFGVGAKIISTAEENFSTSAHGSNLAFYTVPDTTATQTQRMRILGNGNVGIGTSSPTHNLDVVGTVNGTGAATFGSLAVNGSTVTPTVFGQLPYNTGHSIIYPNQLQPATAGTSTTGVAFSYYCTIYPINSSVTVSGLTARVIGTSAGNSSFALQGALFYNLVTSGGLNRPGTLIDYADGSGGFPTGTATSVQSMMHNGTDTINIPGPGIIWTCMQKFDATATFATLNVPNGVVAGLIGTSVLGNAMSAGSQMEAVSTTGTAFGGANWGSFTGSTTWVENTGTGAPYMGIIVN